MEQIIPHLWYDKEAKEAAEFYTSVFPSSKINNVTVMRDTPSGDCDVVSFELAGHPFMSISAGMLFKFTPAISFLVACSTKEEVDQYWKKLSVGGTALMPLDQYPFSERYGWIQDKYGLSWQIMHFGGREIKQKITPALMFTDKVAGKAEAAMRYYTTVFKDGAINDIMRYGKGKEPDHENNVAYGSFTLNGQEFGAMDSAQADFNFNEAVSLMVYCNDQQGIDYYWSKLSADPKSEQCGWCKDQFGVSWQVVPAAMDDMLASNDAEAVGRVTKAFLKMKKFNLAELERAYRGEVGVHS
jgi:predicted 3-demethylubiquinone-9 3-methyltransferase (glyoxalase superfamily)